MQRHLAPRLLLEACEQIFADYEPGQGESPLDELLELLYQQRKYFWIGIYFVLGDKLVCQAMRGPTPPTTSVALGKGIVGIAAVRGLSKIVPDVTAETSYSKSSREVKSEMVMPVRMGARVLGVIDIQSDRVNDFGSADRILLEEVSVMLARFLTSQGKLLVRHAREQASVPDKARTAGAK